MGVDMATCGRDKGRPHLPQGVAIASGHPGRGGLRGIKDFFMGMTSTGPPNLFN